MIKHFLVLILLFSIGISTQGQAPECKKFKTGKFNYPKLPGKISLRKESIQESYDNGKLEMVWKVRWISECEYELILHKIYNEKILFKKGDKIVATIIRTEGDCFTTTTIFYNAENPKGLKMPPGEMCIEKEK